MTDGGIENTIALFLNFRHRTGEAFRHLNPRGIGSGGVVGLHY